MSIVSEEQQKYIVDVLQPVLKVFVTAMLEKCPSEPSKFLFEYICDLEAEESALVPPEDDLMFHNTLIVLLENHRSNDDSSSDTSNDENTGKMRNHINPKKRRRSASLSTQEPSSSDSIQRRGKSKRIKKDKNGYDEDAEESRSPNRRRQSVASISEIEGIVHRKVRPDDYTPKEGDGTNAIRLETPGPGTLTWSGSQTYAHNRGGRLLTLEEAQSYLSERVPHVLKSTSQWAAVTVEKGEADWVQIGCADSLRPGDSYMEKMDEYPAWGDDTREPLACNNNYVLWMPPPHGYAMVIVEYVLLVGRKEFPLTTTFGEILGYFKDYFDAVGEFRLEDKDNNTVLGSEIKYATKKGGIPIFEMRRTFEKPQKRPERVSISTHLARRLSRRVQFIETLDS